jgi:uncharacterized membrane protein
VLGAFVALLSAATFGLNNAFARRGVITGSVMQGLMITVPIGVPLMFIVALIFGQLGGLLVLPGEAWFWFAFAGVIVMVWGRYCNYRSTQAVGANLTGPFLQGDMIVSLALALVFLNEYITPLRVIGIVLIFFAPMLLFDNKTKKSQSTVAAGASAAGKWQPNIAEGILFAMLAAIAYGSSNVIVRVGLNAAEAQSVTNISIVATMISYAAATITLALVVIATGQLKHSISTEAGAVKSFVVAGILVGFSHMFRYVAIAIAPVSVVAPLLRLGTVFRVIFSTLLNPGHEVFNARVVIVTVLSLIGAVCLSLSTELVLAIVPLPEWLVTIAKWRWP